MVHMFTKDKGVTRCVAMVQYESTPPSVEFICFYNVLRESRGQSPAERLRWASAGPLDARVMVEVARQSDTVWQERFLLMQI